jgi:hypothetical protein
VLAAMNLKTIQSTAVLLAIAEKCLSNEWSRGGLTKMFLILSINIFVAWNGYNCLRAAVPTETFLGVPTATKFQWTPRGKCSLLNRILFWNKWISSVISAFSWDKFLFPGHVLIYGTGFDRLGGSATCNRWHHIGHVLKNGQYWRLRRLFIYNGTQYLSEYLQSTCDSIEYCCFCGV